MKQDLDRLDRVLQGRACPRACLYNVTLELLDVWEEKMVTILGICTALQSSDVSPLC